MSSLPACRVRVAAATALALCLGGSSASHAAFNAYTNRGLWLGAVGTPTATVDYNGEVVDQIGLPAPINLSGMVVDSVPGTNFNYSIDVPPYFSPLQGIDGTPKATGRAADFAALSIFETWRIAFTTPVTAWGADFKGAGDPPNGNLQIEVYNTGGSLVGTLFADPSADVEFMGFVLTAGEVADHLIFRAPNLGAGTGIDAFDIDNIALSTNPPISFGIEHFSVYRAAGPPVPAVLQPVKARDQFVSEEVLLNHLDQFWVPVNKNGEGLEDRISHLACHPIVNGNPGFPVVTVTNQFGRATLAVGAARELCLPTEKLISPGTVKIDHFKCYDVSAQPVDANVELVDQFQGWGGLALDPFLLCNPAEKNGGGIQNPDDHLTCYNVQPAGQPLNSKIPISNQFFDSAEIDVFEPFALCVPSKKVLPEPEAGIGLLSGVLCLGLLARRRRGLQRGLAAGI